MSAKKTLSVLVIFSVVVWVIFQGGVYAGRMIGILVVALLLTIAFISLDVSKLRNKRKTPLADAIVIATKENIIGWFK